MAVPAGSMGLVLSAGFLLSSPPPENGSAQSRGFPGLRVPGLRGPYLGGTASLHSRGGLPAALPGCDLGVSAG